MAYDKRVPVLGSDPVETSWYLVFSSWGLGSRPWQLRQQQHQTKHISTMRTSDPTPDQIPTTNPSLSADAVLPVGLIGVTARLLRRDQPGCRETCNGDGCFHCRLWRRL